MTPVSTVLCHLLRAFAAGLALHVLAAGAAEASQDFESVFEGTSFLGWEVEHTKADARDGMLTVSEGRGWVRLLHPVNDFVLRFDVRLLPEDKAAVFVRAWPTFDKDGTPTDSYRLVLDGRAVRAATAGQDTWRRVEITGTGETLRASVDGALVHSDEMRDLHGYLALGALAGAPVFRNIQLKRIPGSPTLPPPGVYRVDASIETPRVTREVKPQYTKAATAAGIRGTVLLSAVVLPDGTVGDVHVLRSLDRRYGLDREAVSAAKQWRFVPGKREGQPVPVLVTIELTFTLK